MNNRETKLGFLKAIVASDWEAIKNHFDIEPEIVVVTFNQSKTAIEPLFFKGLTFREIYLKCATTGKRPYCIYRNTKNLQEATS
jgi:hypothetical protein